MNPQGWPASTYFGESLEYGGDSSVPQEQGQRNGQFGWPGPLGPSRFRFVLLLPTTLPRCHPERSDPIFSCAPLFGASGREVEGSLFLFSVLRTPRAARAVPIMGGIS